MEFSPPCIRILGNLRPSRSLCNLTKTRLKHVQTGNPGGGNIKNISTQSQTKADHILPSLKRCDSLPGFLGLENFRSRVAISEQGGDYLYEDLYMRSWELAKAIIGLMGNDWTNQKICVLCDTSLSTMITTWGCWMAGNTVVPLPVSAKEKLEFLIKDSKSTVVITTRSQVDKVNPITRAADLRLVVLDESWWMSPEAVDEGPLPSHFVDTSILKDSNALLLYTAGRTGQPRGIFLSHNTLTTQVSRVVEDWSVSNEDTLLHTLPTHQMYGLNSLYAPLSVGARIIALHSFESAKVWSHLLGVKNCPSISVFPGTPEFYKSLMVQAGELFKDKRSREYARATCSKKVRLMTSSATSLPDNLNTQWTALTGHKILNNYVSTEAGIVLSNRIGGAIHIPGPGCSACGAPTLDMQARLVLFRDHTRTQFDVLLEDGPNGVTVENEDQYPDGVVGEFMIKGLTTAKKLWDGKREIDIVNYNGWIPTGDIVKYKAGCYSVVGKLNIKTIEREGQLVNAAEIERTLLSNSDIDDVTVLGLGDTDSEQRIAALLVMNKNKKMTMDAILNWCNTNLQPHMVPSVLKIVEDIPRDKTGHVNKFRIFQHFPDVSVLCFHDSKL